VDNTMMLAMQSQRVLQRRLETSANNLANVDTTGFKADSLVLRKFDEDPARSTERPNDIRFVQDITVVRDFSPGAIRQTGAPFDLAIQGEGFFVVEGANRQPMLTRDGAFQLTADGTLVTRDGLPLLNADNQPIVLDPQGERPAIDGQGVIRVLGQEVGRLQLAQFDQPGLLAKAGDNLWEARGQQAQPFEGTVTQGALEGSNVRAVVELTRIMEISRAYESAARIVRSADDLRKSAIERIGRA
jgi:flagellar basal-body rod protein FlgF